MSFSKLDHFLIENGLRAPEASPADTVATPPVSAPPSASERPIPRRPTKAGDYPPPPDDEADTGFPADALPRALRVYVETVCQSLRVPLDLAAPVALGILSLAIGKGIAVQTDIGVLARANLYVLGVAFSGSGKSLVFKELMAPVLDYEAEVVSDFKTRELPRLRAEKALVEKEIDLPKKNYKPKDRADPDRDPVAELANLEKTLAELEVKMTIPILHVSDVTSEELGVLLQGRNEVLASTSADAGSCINNLLGRYNSLKRTDDTLLVSAWSGDAVDVARVNRPPVALRAPCLSLIWLVQEDKIQTLFANPALLEGGFLPRCLISNSRAEPARMHERHRPIDPESRSAWRQLIRGLLHNYRDLAEPKHSTLAPDALALLRVWHNGNVDAFHSDYAHVSRFFARWKEHAYRLAVVLHAAADPKLANREISRATMSAAIRLVCWFRGQLMRLHESSESERRAKQLERIHELVAKNGSITASEAAQSHVFGSAETAARFLDQLAGTGEMTRTCLPPPARGGRQSVVYTLPRPPAAP